MSAWSLEKKQKKALITFQEEQRKLENELQRLEASSSIDASCKTILSYTGGVNEPFVDALKEENAYTESGRRIPCMCTIS
mmetsp:Transcript_40872/g.55666  ORF Transcript_40872/g.55666 Transcript_40872/m.55666 type:complete len:80 (+) Transcript_40872:76-315(+)